MHNDYYEKRKLIKIEKYKKANKNLIELYQKDIDRLDDILPNLLSKHKIIVE